jgi:ABC-type transporter Mla MlaB component
LVPTERTSAARNGSSRPPPPGVPITFGLDGRVERAGITDLCGRVRALLQREGPGSLVCDVGTLVDPDAATVEALARVQLTVRRLGWELRLANERRDLRDLLVLMGLSDVLPPVR